LRREKERFFFSWRTASLKWREDITG